MPNAALRAILTPRVAWVERAHLGPEESSSSLKISVVNVSVGLGLVNHPLLYCVMNCIEQLHI